MTTQTPVAGATNGRMTMCLKRFPSAGPKLRLRSACRCVLMSLCAACGEERVASSCVSATASNDSLIVSTQITSACSLDIRATGIVLRSDSVDPRPPVERLMNGYFVSAVHSPGQLALWTPSGELDRLIGRRGKGPGELHGRLGVLYVDKGDSLHVVDGTARWTIFSPEMVVVRQIGGGVGSKLTNLKGTNFLSDGRIVISPSAGHSRTTHPFYVLDRQGAVVASFGAGPSPELAPDLEDGYVLDVAGDTTFWASRPSKYVVELWSATGDRLKVIQRKVDWFEESEDLQSRRRAMSPSRRIVTLRSDSSGFLWSITTLPAAAKREPSNDRSPFPRSDPDADYDWRIEVIDPGTGSLIADSTFQRMSEVPIFSRSGLIYRFADDKTGATFIEVVTVRVRPK